VQEDLAGVVGEPGGGLPALEQLQHLLAGTLPDDADLVLLVLPESRDLVLLDGARALVLLDTLAREDAGVDHGPFDPGRDAQARVADRAGLLAEERAEQLLLGRQLRLALRGDLPDEDVARLPLGADADDPGLVEVLARVVADVRGVARDLLGAELGVA